MILRRIARHRRRATTLVAAAALLATATPVGAALPAFPGAVGQGAAAVGGRGGDVYDVMNLLDYAHKDQPQIPGSQRYGIQSATVPGIIVFDVGGPIKLFGRLEIRKHYLTIAGLTGPGGITLCGNPFVGLAHRGHKETKKCALSFVIGNSWRYPSRPIVHK